MQRINPVLAFGFCTAIIVLGFTALKTFEKNPLSYPNEPFPVEGPVKVGEVFRFKIERCAEYEVNYRWTEYYENSFTKEQYVQPGSSATAQEGCQDVKSVPKQVPIDLKPGNYRLFFNLEVDGKFKKHKIILRTEPFDVIE